jgi:hypothetical protein
MISAIAFDLVPEATEHIAEWQTVLWMLIGVAIFLLGAWLVDKRFGSAGAGGAMGIVVGSVVDGVPESIIFGIQIGTGATISAGFLAAVFVSNVPQAIAPSADLAASGWGRGGSGHSVGVMESQSDPSGMRLLDPREPDPLPRPGERDVDVRGGRKTLDGAKT